MRCDQCKHWEAPKGGDWELDGAGMGRCNGIIEYWQVTESVPRDEKETWKERCKKVVDALTAARAVARDGSQYFACIHTRPDFFCVLFAAK